MAAPQRQTSSGQAVQKQPYHAPRTIYIPKSPKEGIYTPKEDALGFTDSALLALIRNKFPINGKSYYWLSKATQRLHSSSLSPTTTSGLVGLSLHLEAHSQLLTPKGRS